MANFKNKHNLINKTVENDNNSDNSIDEKIDFHQNIYSGERLQIYPPTFVDVSTLEDSTRKHMLQILPPSENLVKTQSCNDCNIIIEQQSDADRKYNIHEHDLVKQNDMILQNDNDMIMQSDLVPCENNQYFCFEKNCDKNEPILSQHSEYYIYGMMNIRKMEMVYTNFSEFILQINHNDFLYPLTIIDESEKTNKDIPFLFSLDSLLFQFEKRKNGVLISQFFIEDCCFHFIFKILDVCNIKGYQVSLFVQPLCDEKDIHKIFKRNCGYQKILAHSIVMSYHINDGRISFPKKNDKCVEDKKTRKKKR